MLFSTDAELEQIRIVLSNYIRLPFSGDTIPGSVMEAVLAKVRDAVILKTYDFVDVYSTAKKVGWQVKSTKDQTPVTWKRAKIPNQESLIDQSRQNEQGLQALGNAIIKFCNDHALHSLETYGLDEIGYARLILHENSHVTYFERLLCTRQAPKIFNEAEFVWAWSKPKNTVKKEQLPALHGRHRTSGKKWWAWHGLGENQLHFSGENEWWPTEGYPHAATFRFPLEAERIPLERLLEFLEELPATS